MLRDEMIAVGAIVTTPCSVSKNSPELLDVKKGEVIFCSGGSMHNCFSFAISARNVAVTKNVLRICSLLGDRELYNFLSRTSRRSP